MTDIDCIFLGINSELRAEVFTVLLLILFQFTYVSVLLINPLRETCCFNAFFSHNYVIGAILMSNYLALHYCLRLFLFMHLITMQPLKGKVSPKESGGPSLSINVLSTIAKGRAEVSRAKLSKYIYPFQPEYEYWS